VKKITKFTKSTYRGFVACWRTWYRHYPAMRYTALRMWCAAVHRVSWRTSFREEEHQRSTPLPTARLLNRQRYHMVAQYQHGGSTQMPTNLWQPGQSGNPAGRMRGSRNALSEEVICALLRDFRKHGEKAIAKVRRDQPGVWLKVLAMLIPREHKIQHSNPLKDLTDEQLEAMIEYIETSLAAQAGRSVKLIEGTIEPTAVEVTAPPALEPPNGAVRPRERKPHKVPSSAGT
jgi:Family of unknown function (DUF5681)